jgi:hypothetical protein
MARKETMVFPDPLLLATNDALDAVALDHSQSLCTPQPVPPLNSNGSDLSKVSRRPPATLFLDVELSSL